MATKKSGLGRGLSSLISESSGETGLESNEKTNLIDIEKIVANPDQPRKNFDETELSELSESIRKVGVIQPIMVRKQGDTYQIIAGERRFQASKLAGLTEIPVVVKEATDLEVLELALIENLQRSDLNPIEEAQGYKLLIKQNSLTQEQLALAVSKSRSAIANSMRLLDLPDEVQEMLYDGALTAGHARALLAIPDDVQRIKLAKKVIENKLSVRQTENLVPLYSVGDEPKTPRQSMPKSFKRAATQLKKELNTSVKVKQSRGKNKIEIEFKDEDDLLRIIEKIQEG